MTDAKTNDRANGDNLPVRPDVLPPVPKHLRGVPVITDTAELVQATIDRIMAGKSPEQIAIDPDSIGLRDLAGTVIRLESVDGILPSTIRPGDWFVLLSIANPATGEIRTATTGSAYAAATAVKLQAEGHLPRYLRVVELASKSNPGQASLWLVEVEQPKGDEAPF